MTSNPDTMALPDRIRVEQDADGFWTCRQAVSRSPEYIRVDLHEQALTEAENARLQARATAFEAMHKQAEADLLTARTEASAAVKVKPLEWTDLGDGKTFRAFLPIIGSVRVEPYGVCGWWEVLWSMPGQCDKLIPDVFDTPDEAKAAAQADYERRILSALEADPAPSEAKPVAWQRRLLYPSTPGAVPAWEQCSAQEATGHFDRQAGYEYRPLYTHPAPSEEKAASPWRPTHRHVKRGTDYELLGIGKMQSYYWFEPRYPTGEMQNVDMREVAIYRTENGELWVRPREEFEDGRFAPLPADGDGA